MSYIGDFRLGDTLDVKFTTVQSTGAPTTLSSSPVISAYPGNSTTEITAGITLTVDFDARTGLNNVRVVASGGNGYATATNYTLVITTGTVNAVSAVGYVVGEFSIENRSAVMPTTAARTLAVSAAGAADANVTLINSVSAASVTTVNANVGTTQPINFTGTGASALAKSDMVDIAGAAVSTSSAQLGVNVVNEMGTALTAVGAKLTRGIVDSGTAQSATGTTLVIRAAASFADSELVGATVVITGGTTGVGQRRVITANVGATDTLTVDTWNTTPTGTITYEIYASAPGSTASPAPADVRAWNGTAPNNLISGRVDANAQVVGDKTGYTASSVTAVAAGAITNTSFAASAIDAAALATDAGQEIADRILLRNIASGSDGTRTVRDAMRLLRNKASIAAGTLTVTQEDDTTSAWTAAVTTAAGSPISVIDPA